MSKIVNRLALGVLAATGVPSFALADGPSAVVEKEVIAPVPSKGKLTIRGGYSSSSSAYPFAVLDVDLLDSAYRVYESEYGTGHFGHLAYSHDSLFGAFGGEVSFSFNQLSNDDRTPHSDAADIYDVISISHEDGMEGAETANETQFSQFRLMATYTHQASGFQLLGGLGAVDFSSDSEGQMFLPGYYSRRYRSNDYKGHGLVIGARKVFSVTQNVQLQLEGFGGAYTGDRNLKIRDNYDTYPDSFAKENEQTVYSLDLSASVAMPMERVVPGGLFEFGVNYTQLFNVIDTSNYNSHHLVDYKRSGSVEDDVEALSLFFGLQIPL